MSGRIVLVGGQAVNYWADYFSDRIPELKASGPYTSKDVDFLGDADAARACAARLGGQIKVPPPFDPTPNSAIVSFHDHAGQEREIDFLHHCIGLDSSEIERLAIPLELFDPSSGRSTGAVIRVMHPVHCLESRVYNIAELPGGDTPNARKQLRAAVLFVPEFLRDLLAESRVRDVLNLNERIFGFCFGKGPGRRIHLVTGNDPFEAVLAEAPLPDDFLNKRYPRMKEQLARRRKSLAP